MLLRRPTTIATAVLLAAAGLTPAATAATAHATRAAAPHHWAPAKGVGDQCIVGKWRDKAGDGGQVTWGGKRVDMHGGAGAIEKDWASGRTVTSFKHSKPYYGRVNHHMLTMVDRGKAAGFDHFNRKTHHYRFEGTRLIHFRMTFYYKGQRIQGMASQPPWYGSGRYTCDPKSYTTNAGNSTRLSRTP